MVACCRSIMFKARYFFLTFKTCHSKIYPNADYQLVNTLLKTFRLKHIFQPVYELSRKMYVLYYEIFFEIFCYLIYR